MNDPRFILSFRAASILIPVRDEFRFGKCPDKIVNRNF